MTTAKINKARAKSHNFIQTSVAWIWLIFTFPFSIIGGLLRGFIDNGKLLGGATLMLFSFLICVDNYFVMFTRTALLERCLSFSFDVNFFVFLTTSILTWLLVEYLQGEALKARAEARETAQIVGISPNKQIMFLGFAATILEGISIIFGFWSRGGLNLFSLVLAGIALWGYKLGKSWIEGDK